MSKSPKFMVFHLIELIYTLLIIVLVIILAVLLFNAFSRSNSKKSKESMYRPGVYSSNIDLGNATLEIKMTFDENHINDIKINNLSESVSAMYPLIIPTFESISTQIKQNNSTDNINCPETSQFTGQLLLHHITNLVSTAEK